VGLFGKDNDNSALLHQILKELATLRQQVTGQQHAIDQIRQDTTAAINTGLTETRAVVRDGLERHREAIGDPLARIGTELVSLRAALNDLAPTAPQPGPEPEMEADQNPETAREPQLDTDLLKAAAGISYANLQAHRDTWAFLVKHASSDPHFHIPGDVKDAADTANVRISGPSIVAALIRLGEVSRTDPSPVTRAIAEHLHDRLTETVREIISKPQRGDGAEPIRIVIDDRAAPPTNEE
jgi:hypothetical protein